jgi:hypothetical protein
MSCPLRAARQREIVAALLVRQPEVVACLAPLRSMRRDTPPACAVVCEQMRQLVPQGAIDFPIAKLAQPWIERDERPRGLRGPCSAAHARIPNHAHFSRKRTAAERSEELARVCFEGRIRARERRWL